MESGSPSMSTATTDVYVAFSLSCHICGRHSRVIGVYTKPSLAITAARLHDEGLDVMCSARAVSGGRFTIDDLFD